jgi:transcriptional regulator with XRE-family HTH domain
MRMSDIYERIGERIREFRTTFNGKGLSQENLAKHLNTTANTVSRWETAVYKPSISDIELLAKFFGVPITEFFPQHPATTKTGALLSAAQYLEDSDLEEVTRYALFRRATTYARK